MIQYAHGKPQLHKILNFHVVVKETIEDVNDMFPSRQLEGISIEECPFHLQHVNGQSHHPIHLQHSP